MYVIMHKWIYSFTISQCGVLILPSWNLLPVISMGFLMQWFGKVICWLVFSPDLVDSGFPSIHIIPEAM